MCNTYQRRSLKDNKKAHKGKQHHEDSYEKWKSFFKKEQLQKEKGKEHKRQPVKHKP